MAFFKKTHAHNACTSNGVCIFLVLHITPPFGMGCGIARGASSAKRKEKEKKKVPKKQKSVGEIYHCHRDFGDRRGHEVTVYEPGGDG